MAKVTHNLQLINNIYGGKQKTHIINDIKISMKVEQAQN